MKIITFLSLCLLFLVSSAFGELTKEDLRTIVKEENAALEKRLKEYIDLKIETVNARIDTVEGKLSARIDALEGNVNRLWLAILALIAAAVALPQLIIVYSERKRGRELEMLLQQLRDKNETPAPSS